MAKRLLRDWTTSDKVNSLNAETERFFTRLIMKADDHGCFHANPKLLKAALFPLLDITINQVKFYILCCEDAGLIKTYYAEGKNYLQINEFGQRLRSMKSNFPQPADNPPTIVSECPPEVEVEEEVEEEIEEEGELKKVDLIDFFFNDLENSSHFEKIATLNKISKEELKKYIPKFKPKAELEYPNFLKFANHFKNYVGIELNKKNNHDKTNASKPADFKPGGPGVL